MWRWARAYGIGGSSLYLVLIGLVLLLLAPEGDANVFWIALILGAPALGAGLYLRGCLQESGIAARAERIVGWVLMVTGCSVSGSGDRGSPSATIRLISTRGLI
jgi:hypothetical protein